MCANIDIITSLSYVAQLYSLTDVAGLKGSRRKGPTKMQQALNAGNVHSKRTVSKPLILLVIKSLFVVLTDLRLLWLSLSKVLWQLTFHDWQLVCCCRLGARTNLLYECRIFSDRHAPVLINHKSCWMAVTYFLNYMDMRRKQRESSCGL